MRLEHLLLLPNFCCRWVTVILFGALAVSAGESAFRLHTQRFGNTWPAASGTERNQPGQLIYLLKAFCQGALQLVALTETGLDFGKGDSVDDKRQTS